MEGRGSGNFKACGSRNLEDWLFIYSYFKIANVAKKRGGGEFYKECKLSEQQEKIRRTGIQISEAEIKMII